MQTNASMLDTAGPDAAYVRDMMSLFRAGRYAEMHGAARHMTSQWPVAGIGWKLLGACLQVQHRTAEALPALERACKLLPTDAEVHNNLGVALKDLGRAEEAVAHFSRAVALDPRYAQAQENLGIALNELRRVREAIACLERAVALKPDCAGSQNNLGVALKALGRVDKAVACFERAVALQPDHVEARNNLGVALRDVGRADEALFHLQQAVAIDPCRALAHENLGIAMQEAGHLEEALACFERVLSLSPDRAEARNNLGVALMGLHRLEEALACFRRAVALKPGWVEPHGNLGAAATGLGRLDEAVGAYENAVTLRETAQYHLNIAHLKRRLGAWDAAEAHEAAVRVALRGLLSDTDWPAPFMLLCSPAGTAAEQLICASHFAHRYANRMATPGFVAAVPATGRLRLGYLSNRFHCTATACLLAEVIERHDRTRFEVIAYDYGPATGDAYRLRLENAFDRIVRIDTLSDEAAARLMAADGVGIAIDLKGWTADTRSPILAYRPAPVQVQWLGYPGSMGAPWIDYLIADRVLIASGEEPGYSEKLIRMPDTYIPTDRRREIGAKPTRAEAGLPEKGVVLACFNQAHKITRDVFAAWLDVLDAVPGSVLWLLEDNRWCTAALVRAAVVRSIDPRRIVMAPRLAVGEHLGRLQLADLALDCAPYGSHTTACDALWAGVPMVALRGATFASRVSTSILSAAGLDEELVTRSLPEYWARILRLTQDDEAREAIRKRLFKARLQCPLFDSERFTRHFEAALEAMWARRLAGLPPDHFDVPARA